MKTELRSDKSYKASITLFFILTLLSLVCTAVVGEILLPITAAFYALLFVFEKNKHVLSIICAAVSVALLLIPVSILPVWCAVSVLCGLVLGLAYRFGNSKCDTAVILTLFIAIAIIFSFVLIAFVKTGDYSLDSAFDFYSELYERLRSDFVNGMMQAMDSVDVEGIEQIEFTPEYFGALIDGVVNLLVSYVFIISFVLAGLTLKIFTAVARRFADEECEIKNWKFAVPSIYAYLYIAVYLLSSFAYGDGLFDLSVLNLSGIFATVFAYIGLKAVLELFSNKNRKGLGIVILFVGFALLGSLALDVISVFGVVYTIQQNKLLKNGQGTGSGS